MSCGRLAASATAQIRFFMGGGMVSGISKQIWAVADASSICHSSDVQICFFVPLISVPVVTSRHQNRWIGSMHARLADLKPWRSCHFFESNCIASMIIIHGNGIILSWTWQWHNSVMNTCMTSFYDFISLQTPDCRLFFHWLNSDWTDSQVLLQMMVTIRQRRGRQLRQLMWFDVMCQLMCLHHLHLETCLSLTSLCPNCGASKWFTYRSLHSLMNLMQLWHSWQLTLANGIMDNHGIDSTWQWIDSWKLEVVKLETNALMTSWHHSTLRWSPTVVLARDSWLGFGIRDIVSYS